MKNKYYCGKCEHIGMYTGSYTHGEKLCKRYAAILKVDGNDVQKCVPCICETLEAENVALRNEADENAALSMENKMRADRLEKENAALRERLDKAIELPCKVGDTLYEPFADNVIREWIVESIYVGRIGIRATCHRKDDYKWHDTFAIGKYYNDFGEKGRVCFTREAAKARLKEKGGRE